MATFIMVTRIAHEQHQSPVDLIELAKKVMRRVYDACPQVQWLHSYAVMGPYEYLDIFNAPNIETATKVATLFRTMGHGHAEIWPATDWDRYKELLGSLNHLEGIVTSGGEHFETV